MVKAVGEIKMCSVRDCSSKSDGVMICDISGEMSRHMSVMSFLCACLIVMIHCTPRLEASAWQWWVVNFFGGDGICRIAVPWFFVASGFFLAGRINDSGWYLIAIKKRIRTLLVPFVVWALAGVMFDWCMWYGIQAVGYDSQIRNPLSNGFLKR